MGSSSPVRQPWRRFGEMMPNTWIVWGRGGHGRVVADLLRTVGETVAGFADSVPGGVGCVAEQSLIESLTSGGPLPLGATRIGLGLGDNDTRWAAWQRVPSDAAPAVIHPTAWISPSATVGAGTVVMPLAVVHADARIGEAVILNTGCIVEHDCVLAGGAHISPGAILTGNVSVGECAWVGAGAVVIPGVKLGSHCIVGAGAVVTRDVAAGATVVGNPARQQPSRA